MVESTNLTNTVISLLTTILKSPVNIHSNFFDLGGDSLEMTEFVSQINTLYHSSFTIKQFLSLPGNIDQYIALIETSI